MSGPIVGRAAPGAACPDRKGEPVSVPKLPDYAVISPVKDEEAHLARTAESLIAQSHRPVRWVIVDDGSTDDTEAIALRYAAEHDWISVVHSAGRDRERARGGKIVQVFNTGLAALEEMPEIVVKLDGDLFLPSHYFAWVAAAFARAPKAGIVGGVTQLYDGGHWRPEERNNLTGAAKAYRSSCLLDIGGLKPSMGWDGIDEYGARARGWDVHVLKELTILHFKARGSRQPWYRARWEEGVGAHYMGYRFEFLLVRAAYLTFVQPPLVLGALAMVAGFLHARLKGAATVDDGAARRLLRAEQRSRLARLARLGSVRVETPALPDGGPAFWLTDWPAPTE